MIVWYPVQDSRNDISQDSGSCQSAKSLSHGITSRFTLHCLNERLLCFWHTNLEMEIPSKSERKGKFWGVGNFYSRSKAEFWARFRAPEERKLDETEWKMCTKHLNARTAQYRSLEFVSTCINRCLILILSGYCSGTCYVGWSWPHPVEHWPLPVPFEWVFMWSSCLCAWGSGKGITPIPCMSRPRYG